MSSSLRPPVPGEGTTPPGAASEEQAARWVRGMFDSVAPRYDLLNRVLSFRTDVYWRKRTVRCLRAVLESPHARVLDICCGTGDLMLALEHGAAARVYGSDFSHPMLRGATEKMGSPRRLFEADALRLPLADSSLDLITVAFGFRNFSNYRRGLEEMRRVLRPGGTAAILEFSQPPNRAFAAVYRFYSNRVLPVVGGWISGSRDAYRYLPESVGKFPDAPALAERMREAGFVDVQFQWMTAGIVALHTGRVSA